jgi:uncharacterized protein YkwD
MTFFIFFFLFSFTFSWDEEYKMPEKVKLRIIKQVNYVRTRGCICGDEYMKPVKPVTWNETLYTSALSHARDMDRNNFFDHFSSDGKNVGERLDGFGYIWIHIGENLGTGQISFSEVLKDWIESPSHCKMLMNPEVKEMGVAKYKTFWVQHFGSRIPHRNK